MLNGVSRWLEERVLRILEDGGTIAAARGYKDAALGLPEDYASVAGDPFGAAEYHGGYGLAEVELRDRVA